MIEHFATDYRDARRKFLEACEAAGVRVETYENPAPGPDGDPVYTDVALVGEESADTVLLANSATHGVEGFCGSGVLVGWLRAGRHRELPGKVRAVLIHAINPHGFAWLRRVTEDNVDLNRNFIDHNGHYPENPEYNTLQPVILPRRWDHKALAKCMQVYEKYMARHGKFALQSVITRGQYDHPDGIFYGGRAATWSNRTFNDILARFVKGARHVAFLDFHSGLGPYGAAELISGAAPGSALGERLETWYGHGLSSMASGNSSSAALSGIIGGAVRGVMPAGGVTSVTVEYGTYPVEEVLFALQADNWLHHRGDLDSPLGRQIKAEIRKRLYPDENDWKELVFLRARQILDRAVNGLATL